ncbi:hypothetical protein AOLI_G00177160 [Acnodon oligacanthus]
MAPGGAKWLTGPPPMRQVGHMARLFTSRLPQDANSSHDGRTPEDLPHFAKSPIGRVLQNLQEFYLDSEPTRKDRENAKLRKSHAMHFIRHMNQRSPSSQFTDLKFLYDFQQI